MVLLLMLITCGLYYFYWLYVISKEVEEFTGEADIPPIVDLLLFILTGTLWGFVWDWRIGQKIAQMQERVGLPRNDESILYLVLDFLGAGPVAGLGIVVPLIQQSRLNQVYDRARTGMSYRSF
jgi:hypothetical protein